MLKTWDIFDTLIARRCINPKNVFKIIEDKTKFKNFAEKRILAERNISIRTSNYGIADIYDEFLKIDKNSTAKDCATLRELECYTEIDQAIPITENILKVKSGDILISDMYLPEKVIKIMLEKCGLFVPVEIVITTNGKSSGRIWKQIAAQDQFVFHIGDNKISDIKNPRDAGFDSSISVLTYPNEAEQILMEKDFNFAAYLREIRLKNPYMEENKRRYWNFATLNAGILIILAELIDGLRKKYDFEYLGFCGRDTYYLYLIYKRFFEVKYANLPSCDYLYYSRKLIYTSENEMVKYFTSKIDNRKALIIDLGGTGLRLNHLRTNMERKFSILMCYLYSQENIGNWKSFHNFPEHLNEDDNFYFIEDSSDTLEFLNRATHNTPIKLNTLKIGEKLIPSVVFSEVSDTENLDVLESCLKEILSSSIQWGNGENIFDNLLLLTNILKKMTNNNINKEKHYLNDTMDKQFTFAKKNLVPPPRLKDHTTAKT